MTKPVNGINEYGIDQKKEDGDALNILYINIPGTKPKLTKSAKESNWRPISDFKFNFLAINPSK